MIILLFIIIFFAAFFTEQDEIVVNKKIVLAFLCFLMSFTEAIRFKSGTDYWQYYNFFHGDFSEFRQNHTFEPLYTIIVFLFQKVTNSFFWFDLFYFILLYSLYFFSLPKITNKYIVAFFLIFCMNIGFLGSNRQLMALSISFFATVYFLPKEKLYFILWVIVASLFHYSALITLLFVFLDRKIPEKFLGIIFSVFIILLFTNLNQQITSYFVFLSHLKENYTYYFNEKLATINLNQILVYMLGIIRKIFPVAILIYFKKIFQNRKYYTLILNINFLSLIFYLFSINNLPILNSRLSLYFIIYEAITIAWLFEVFRDRNGKIAYPFVLIYGAALFVKGISSYPELFIPYKNIFFTF